MYDYFYRNPRLLILTTCLILVAGLSSFVLLPRMEDPVLAKRVATINTIYPGANAERVESLVTEPIEDALREIEEIKEVRSQSRSGISLINVTLGDHITEVDVVWSRIRDKLGDTEPELPADAMAPVFRELEIKAYASIVALIWERPDEPNYSILRRHAETLKDRLLSVSGTEKIRLFGAPDEEFLATIDPDKLSAIGITPAQVAAAMRNSDAKSSAGLLRGNHNDFLIEVGGELNSLDRISRTPVWASVDGGVIRLEDFAEVSKGVVEPLSSLAVIENHGAVVLGVLVRNEERIDRWAGKIDTVLEAYSAELPAGIRLEQVFQQSEYVTNRLGSLMSNLILGAGGVMLVIFLLMGWRSALIVGIALPLSSLMVLTGMRMLGIPIHQMSVTGLIIAIGLLIDNAIVMVDEVGAALAKGESPGDAVKETVRHLSVPLLGSTVTTALGFAPIALMPGPAGEFVGSIAISVILAIFSSLFVSMTVVPALTAAGMPANRSDSWLARGVSLHRISRWYSRSLKFIFAHPLLGLGLGVTLPIIGFIVAPQLPEQFFPPADRDQFQIELELPSQSSIAETTSITREIRDLLMRHEKVTRVEWFIGESAPAFYYNVIPRRQNASNYAQAMVQLESLEGSRDIIREMQLELDQKFPQARTMVRQLEQVPPFDAPVQIRLYGPDLETLRRLGDQVRDRLAMIPDVLHTRSDLAESISKVSYRVDEEKARTVGLDHRAIAAQLQTSLEGVTGGSVLESTEELPVRIRVGNERRSSFSQISSIALSIGQPADGKSDANLQIPLSALTTMELTPESATIPHRNSERMNEVQAYITAGVLPADVLSAFQTSVSANPIEIPTGYRLEFGGEAAERDNAVGNLLSSVGILIVLMIATLVTSFGSFRMSAIIGGVAALSMGLGLLALWLFGYPFGFMAIIGSMGLMGVAINDAIVVLAGIRANEQARDGDPQAIQDVVLQTTRHIIATSLTTMAGFAPLVVAGGEFWPPMAIAISGGVAGATVLALYFVPSMYLLLNCRGCMGDGAPLTCSSVKARLAMCA